MEMGHEVYVPNLPGRGASHTNKPLGGLSIKKDFAPAISALLSKLARHAPIRVWAHSMGAAVAVQSAAHEPQAVRDIVLLNPPPPRPIPFIGPAIVRIWKYLATMFAETKFEYTEKDYRELLCNGLPEAVTSNLYRTRVPESGYAAKEMCFFGWGLPASRLKSISTLVVGATEDRLIPPFISRLIARKYHAPLQMVAGGHMSVFSDYRATEKIVEWENKL